MNRKLEKDIIRVTGQIAAMCAIGAMCAVCFGGPLFNSFNSGELSGRMKYRTDLEKRYMGVETMTNFTVKPQGAAIRRSGTAYIADVNDPNNSVRLIPFEYSTTDSYVLEFSDGHLRFYR